MGFKVLTDQPMGKQRWIELTLPGAQTGIVLFTPEGQEDRIGTFFNGSFHCDDVEHTVRQFPSAGSTSHPRRSSPGGSLRGFGIRTATAGAGLAILVFCTGAATLFHAAQRRGPGLNAARGVRYLEMLVAFDGFGLLAFAGLVAVALWLRRRPEWHKRLMLLATLSLLGPAFGRITAYVNHMQGDNDVGVLLLCVACVVICAVVDSVRHRRLHQAFVGGGGLVLTMYLTTYVAKTLLQSD
jgi:hypothetical protein